MFMLKKVMFLMAVGALTLMLSNQSARAQADDNKKFELGGQFSLMRLPTLTATTTTFPCVNPPCPVITTFAEGRESEPGFGGRFGYNFSRYFALEAEGNFFPRDRDLDGGRKLQGLFGARVGKRFDKVGLFGKARPGVVRFDKGDYRQVGVCIASFPAPIACFEPTAKTNLAFDLGGVVEWYPSKHTIVRFDAGNTIVRFGTRNVAATDVGTGGRPISLVVIPVLAETKHNFQGSIGLGWRF